MTKRDYFIPKMFYRLLIPSVFSSIGFAFADMADTLALGQSLGETGLAAVGLSLPVFMLINLFMDGFGIGGTVYFSQKLGEGNVEKAKDCFNAVLTAVLIIGFTLSIGINVFINPCLKLLGTVPADGEVFEACKTYIRIIAFGAPIMMLNIVFSNFLRNDNNANIASIGFIIGNAMDIFLNIVLVIFFKMGTMGAAIATVIGSFTAVILYLPGIIGKRAGNLKICRFKFSIKEIFGCFKTGFATSVTHLLQLFFFLFINRLLMRMAGESGAAVFDMVYNISFFIIYIYNGICEAMQPLVSTFYGENNEGDCKNILKLSKICMFILGAAASGLIFIFAEKISMIFGMSYEMLTVSVGAVRIYCVGFAFIGINMINEKYYQSKNKFLPSFIIVVLREFAVLILCAYVFAKFGIGKVWIMYPMTELITFILFLGLKKFVLKNDNLINEDRIFRITISNDNKDIENALNGSIEFCGMCGANDKQKYAVTLAIEEICMSIIRNAMKSMTDGKIRITLMAMPDGSFILKTLDNASTFNPFSFIKTKQNSDNEFDIDEISIKMIKNITQKFMYRKFGGFNSLTMQV